MTRKGAMSIWSCGLVLFLFVCFVGGCSEGSSEENTTEDGDADGDEEDDTNPQDECTGNEPSCDEDTLLTCDEDILTRTPCPEGTFCNLDHCQETTVRFPDDAGFHEERSEWWYYTGHLSDESGTKHYGFEVTLFQYDMASFSLTGNGYMCHVAITDEVAKEHYHVDTLALTSGEWTNDPIVLEFEYCRFELDGNGNDHVYGIIPEGEEKDGKASPWVLDITVVPQKRRAYHGGDGIIPMSDSGGTSWYYSYTRLSAQGTLTTPEGDVSVSGQAWMDHQWGEFDISEFRGWDWWSMQFDDGWEVMLFQFTDWDGNLASQAGTLIDAEGNTTELEGFADFTVTPRRQWESPHTDGVYPLDWDIRIEPVGQWPGMDLVVTTAVDDQEMTNPAQNYWEGSTKLEARFDDRDEVQFGVGYTELTGYATDLLDPKP